MSFLNSENPLGLPKGSVRAIITLALIATAIYLYVEYNEIPETLKAIVSLIIGYYFAQAQGRGP